MARDLPFVSEERIAELVRLGPESEGHAPYQRESAPLNAADREVLDRLDDVVEPASAGIIFLWSQGKVIFIGASRSGLFGYGIPAHAHGSASRYGVAKKNFDKISFHRCAESALDLAVAALARLLRPKHNRVPQGFAAEAEQAECDRKLVAAIGIPVTGWRGSRT